MFKILKDKTICLTQGDVANIEISASLQDGKVYSFQPGEIVRFIICKKQNCGTIYLKKEIEVTKEEKVVSIQLIPEDTRFEKINIPTEYWYEVELNPYTNPQTIIGYDEAGEKIFRIYPEGGADK